MPFEVTKKGWKKATTSCLNCDRRYDIFLDDNGDIVKAQYLILTKKENVFRCPECDSELTWMKTTDYTTSRM